MFTENSGKRKQSLLKNTVVRGDKWEKRTIVKKVTKLSPKIPEKGSCIFLIKMRKKYIFYGIQMNKYFENFGISQSFKRKICFKKKILKFHLKRFNNKNFTKQ